MKIFNDEWTDNLSEFKILSFEEVSTRFEGNKNPLENTEAYQSFEEISYDKKFGDDDKCSETKGDFYAENMNLNMLLNDINDRTNGKFFFDYQNYALVNPTVSAGISPSTMIPITTSYTPQKYFEYTQGNEKKSALLNVELNERACFISLKNSGSVFYLNPEKEKIEFRLEFVYTDYLDKRVFNSSTRVYDLGKKYNAIVIKTSDANGFVALSEQLRINNDGKKEILNLFADKIKQTKDAAALKFLYENMPEFVIDEILKRLEQDMDATVTVPKDKNNGKVKITSPVQEFFWNHMEILSDYDDKGFFSWTKDSSGALINLLKIFKDSQFIFESFKNNQAMVKRIFDNMNETSAVEIGGIKSEVSNKTIFANFINALCIYNAFDGSNFVDKEFIIGKNYAFSSGSVFQDEEDDEFFLQQLMNVTRTETEIIPDDLPSQVQRIKVERTSLEPLGDGNRYHPMDIVRVRYDGEKDFAFPLIAAISIKALAEEREQQELEKNIRIGLDIFLIVVGTATMFTTGNPAVFALAFADVALASADGIITANREEIAAMPGGKEFLEKWEKVYFIGGILLATPATVEFLFARAVGLYRAAIAIKNFEYIKFFRTCILKILLEREILTFAGNTVKVNSGIEIKILEYTGQTISKATGFAFRGNETLLPLYQKGALIFEIAEKEYALIYKGERLIQGTSNDGYLIKFYQELKKVLNNPAKLTELLEIAYKDIQIQRRVKEMAKWIDGKTGGKYRPHELDTLAQMEIENTAVLRPSGRQEAGDAIVVEGKNLGESWDAMGLPNNEGAIKQWSKKYTRERRLFFESIDEHFVKITPDLTKGIPALDKVIIDGKNFDLYNKNLKMEVIDYVKTKYSQYYGTKYLDLLNF